jgi:hypothetical protein
LTRANGGEGFIGESYLILRSIEELISANAAYNVTEFAPQLFLFGSNGGGQAFGFDISSAARPIVSIPFVPTDRKEEIRIAPDFGVFLAILSA